jgi:hypothetical protein
MPPRELHRCRRRRHRRRTRTAALPQCLAPGRAACRAARLKGAAGAAVRSARPLSRVGHGNGCGRCTIAAAGYPAMAAVEGGERLKRNLPAQLLFRHFPWRRTGGTHPSGPRELAHTPCSQVSGACGPTPNTGSIRSSSAGASSVSMTRASGCTGRDLMADLSGVEHLRYPSSESRKPQS